MCQVAKVCWECVINSAMQGLVSIKLWTCSVCVMVPTILYLYLIIGGIKCSTEIHFEGHQYSKDSALKVCDFCRTNVALFHSALFHFQFPFQWTLPSAGSTWWLQLLSQRFRAGVPYKGALQCMFYLHVSLPAIAVCMQVWEKDMQKWDIPVYSALQVACPAEIDITV